MSATYDVHVSAIAPQTTEQHLTEFFSFCGKITSLSFDPAAHSAIIRFEKPGAAKTALMLNGGALDGAHLSVTSPVPHDHPDDHHPSSPTPEHIEQTDKPRSAIAAEYLARGYTLSDQILQRAIELDKQHGISNKFLNYFHSIDSTLGTLLPRHSLHVRVIHTALVHHRRNGTRPREDHLTVLVVIAL